MSKAKSIGYKHSGVNIDEADRAVSSIRTMARRTFTPAVLTDIGSFGGGYLLKGYKEPVLVSSADGVGKLDAKLAAQVVSGMARGCKNNGCALIGGETAEMPGMYAPGEYDLAGFIVGVVERKRMLTGKTIRAGDVLIGLPSTGLHTNGYSLARKLLFEVAGHRADTRMEELGGSLAQELMKVHRSYLKPLRALHDAGILKGAAHITGGGITDNTPRILPKGLGVRIDVGSWPVLPMFELLRKIGRIPEDDWRRTFNLGIGMILVISKRDLPKAIKMLKSLRERWYQIGEVVRGSGVVYR